MKPLQHHGRAVNQLPAYASRVGHRTEPTPAERARLDRCYPAWEALMRKAHGVSSDCIGERCGVTRALVVAYMTGRGCVRMNGKWRLPGIVRPHWKPT